LQLKFKKKIVDCVLPDNLDKILFASGIALIIGTIAQIIGTIFKALYWGIDHRK